MNNISQQTHNNHVGYKHLDNGDYRLTYEPRELLQHDSILLNNCENEQGAFLQLCAKMDKGLKSYETRVEAIAINQVKIHDTPFIKNDVQSLKALAEEHKSVVLSRRKSLLCSQSACRDERFYILSGKRSRKHFPNCSEDEFVLCFDEKRPERLRKLRKTRAQNYVRKPPVCRIFHYEHIWPIARALSRTLCETTGLDIQIESSNKENTIKNIKLAIELLSKLTYLRSTIRAMLNRAAKGWTSKFDSFLELSGYIKQVKPRDDLEKSFRKSVDQLERMFNGGKRNCPRRTNRN